MKMDDNDDEYVKVKKLDDFIEFGMVDDDDDDMGYVKIEYTVNGLVNESLVSDLENEESGNDLDNEDSDEDIGIGDECNDVKHKIIFFTRSTKAVEIKDLVKDIVLPYLPAKSLTRFRSVSKEWGERTKSPFLAHQQSYYFKKLSGFFCQSYNTSPTFVTLDQTAYGIPTPYLDSFLPEDVDILSSCNGLLICQTPSAFGPYYVCNPATRDWTSLPGPTVSRGNEAAVVLAFEPSVLNMEANYLVLRVVSMNGCFYFDIYSSETDSWEVSGTTVVDVEGMIIKDNTFYMNGIVYMETSMRSVIAFHPLSEVYEVIPLPLECPTDGVLTQFGGELCYVGVSQHAYSDRYSIKVYAGMELTLKHQVHVTIGEETWEAYPRYRVLPCLDGENVMVVMEDGMMYSCSLSDGSVEEVTRIENASASVKYVPYVNSLVHVAKPCCI